MTNAIQPTNFNDPTSNSNPSIHIPHVRKSPNLCRRLAFRHPCCRRPSPTVAPRALACRCVILLSLRHIWGPFRLCRRRCRIGRWRWRKVSLQRREFWPGTGNLDASELIRCHLLLGFKQACSSSSHKPDADGDDDGDEQNCGDDDEDEKEEGAAVAAGGDGDHFGWLDVA